MKRLACALLWLPSVAMCSDFAERRVTGLDFESVPAAEAFARIAAQAGIGVTLDDCPPAGTRVSARAVSGRLPVVLDRLTAALGCTWRERGGAGGAVSVLYVQGKTSAPLPAPTAPMGKPADKVAETPAAVPAAPSITLRLGSTDIPTYALRDFLLSHGMSLVWGAGTVASVATVPGDYTGDTPLAAVDTLLRAHGLRGVYAHSNKTLYVR